MTPADICEKLRDAAKFGHKYYLCGKHIDDLNEAADFIEQQERRVAEQQAHIDRLMLEYCPDEMTPEQVENWAAHQREATKLTALTGEDKE